VVYFDPEFLYKLYTKEIDLMQALVKKQITLCLVDAISTIIGLEKGDPVKIYCIRQNNSFWYSKQKYLKMKDNNIRILTE
jgi:hypothetical protein